MYSTCAGQTERHMHVDQHRVACVGCCSWINLEPWTSYLHCTRMSYVVLSTYCTSRLLDRAERRNGSDKWVQRAFMMPCWLLNATVRSYAWPSERVFGYVHCTWVSVQSTGRCVDGLFGETRLQRSHSFTLHHTHLIFRLFTEAWRFFYLRTYSVL